MIADVGKLVYLRGAVEWNVVVPGDGRLNGYTVQVVRIKYYVQQVRTASTYRPLAC